MAVAPLASSAWQLYVVGALSSRNCAPASPASATVSGAGRGVISVLAKVTFALDTPVDLRLVQQRRAADRVCND